jgi:26S proteasome regulatory subunit N3
VVKTAVRTISLAYSKIIFADIAAKLLLDSSEDAKFIVAKAIRDGVIEAVVCWQINPRAFATSTNQICL